MLASHKRVSQFNSNPFLDRMIRMTWGSHRKWATKKNNLWLHNLLNHPHILSRYMLPRNSIAHWTPPTVFHPSATTDMNHNNKSHRRRAKNRSNAIRKQHNEDNCFISIPLEIMLRIFEWLSVDDILALRVVCAVLFIIALVITAVFIYIF